MCGIGGIIRYSNRENVITEEQIALLLVGNEHRGNDATGMAFQQQDGSIQILKDDEPAWRFVSSKDYKSFIEANLRPDTSAVILHTRGASQGNPRDNENNHPMYAGMSAVIHNGSIKNDTQLFNTLNLKRQAATDTDIIRAIVDEFGLTEKGLKMLDKMSGSMASAAFHPEYPGKVLLMRSGAPMTLASTPEMLVFASEKNTIHKAMRPIIERFGIPFAVHNDQGLAFSPMPDHTAWILGPQGIEQRAAVRTLTGTYVEPYRRVYEEYASRSERFDRQKQESEQSKTVVNRKNGGKVTTIHPASPSSNARDYAWCVNCKREWTIPVGADGRIFQCNPANKNPGCGRNLIPMPKKVN